MRVYSNVNSLTSKGGQTISYYMKASYRWLGWGIKGNRELYAYEYLNKLKMFG